MKPARPAPSTPPTTVHRQTTLALLVILAAGLVFRGLYLGEVASQPDYLSPGVDAGFHDYWARALVTGDWTPSPGAADPHTNLAPFVRPPGYPYFLAAVYRLFGVHPLPIRLLQMGLDVVNALLAFAIGRRWFDTATGLLWAAGISLYWGFAYFDQELHAEGPATFLLMLTCWLLGLWLERGRLWPAVVSGLALGLASLLRPNLLPLVVLAAAWMGWVRRAPGERKRALLAAAALVCAAMLAILPATVRNYLVSGEFVLISSNGGINLYIGNNPAAEGYAAGQVYGYGRFHTPNDYPALVRSVERQVGHAVTYAGASRRFAREAIDYAAGHPGHTLKLLGLKTLLFWGPMEIPNNKELNCERVQSPALSTMPLTFPRVLPFALAGMVLALAGLRRNPAWRRTHGFALAALALLLVAGIFLTVLPFFVAGRYRLPMVPFLLLFAAMAVHSWVRLLAQRRWAPAALTAAGLVAVYVATAAHWAGPGPDWARWHLDRGLAYGRLGKFQDALTHYEAALALDSGMVNTRLAAAHALRRLERFEEAVGMLEPIVQAPGPYLAEAQLMLAQVRVEQRRPEDARVHYYAAVAADPHNLAARRELAWLLNVSGRPADALPEIEFLLQAEPGDAEVRLLYGLTLRVLGREAEAQGYIDEALRQRPDLRAALPPQH